MALDDLSERLRQHHNHFVGTEVVQQLPLGDEDCVQEFLYLRVSCLGVKQNLAGKVHGPLHREGVSLLFAFYNDRSANDLRGCCDVQQELFLFTGCD